MSVMCVASGGWCRGEDDLWSGKVCRQVQDPEEICERIMEMPWEGEALCRVHSKSFRQAHACHVEAAVRSSRQTVNED